MCTYRERHEGGMRAIQEDLGWWRKVVRTEERSRAGGRAHFLESASGVEMAGAPEAACSRSSYRTDWLATCWVTQEPGPALPATLAHELVSPVVKSVSPGLSFGLNCTNTWVSSSGKWA